MSKILHKGFAGDPKYRGKMLVGDAAMITEGIICKTCVEMGIEIIEIAVNPDHVHIFFQYVETQDKHHAKSIATGLVLKSGVCD